MELAFVDVWIVDVGLRSDRNEHALAILRKDHVARGVTTSGQLRDEDFCRAGRLYVAAVVRKADDRVGVADVDPLRVGAGWEERHAKWLAEPAGEHGRLLGLAVGAATAQDADLPRAR